MRYIYVEPRITASQIISVMSFLFVLSLLFVFVGLMGVSEQVEFNQGIHKARCAKNYIPGYCAK